jgi:flagellar basal body-associated protein FliL
MNNIDTVITIILILTISILLGIRISRLFIKSNNKEDFIVSDAHDFINYDKHRNEVLNKSDDYTKEELENPVSDNTVNYDDDKKEKVQDFNIQMTYTDHIHS